VADALLARGGEPCECGRGGERPSMTSRVDGHVKPRDSGPWISAYSRPVSLLLLPPRVGVDVDGVAGLSEAVDQRGDASGAREDRAPVLEGQVGGDDGWALLMAAADDVVEHVATARVGRHIPQ